LETFADYYAKGDFPNAMNELMKNRQRISPGLWHFNMGTVKAKMNVLAEARYHFLAAEENGFTDKSLGQNLSIVEDELDVRILEKPLDTMDYAIKFGLWSQNGFLTMVSLMILLGGILILRKEKKYYVLILTILLALIPVGCHFWIGSWDRAVTLTSHEVLEGPSVIFDSRGELPPGVMVVTKESGEWKEVIYPSRFRGWIKAAGLKELE
jgi:hypothetical protein